MLTPAFELTQDCDFLTVAIRVPHARASEFDVYFEGVDFKFYAKPYFLRLTLPGRIVENGSEQGTYDADKGIFTIRLPKETPGQHFEGLNMLTALLAPRKSRSAKPLVEEIGASGVAEEGADDEDEEFDWEIEQTPYEEVSESTLQSQCHYGFGNLRAGVVQRLQDELSEVIDIKDPDFTPVTERRQKRLAAELAKFDPDHYLADFFEDEAVEQILKYSPWWNDAHAEMVASLGKNQEQGDSAALVSFSEEEKYQLRKFVNKSYLLDKTAHRQVYYGLVDILLAYCYEVESAWTIRKLSPTLCWFETWTDVHEILVSFGRRVLCYPLYRHFKLVLKAYRDTIKILQLGKSAVLKCLLDVHKVFQENDPAYILNDLYISDYCVWIQKAKSKKLAALTEALKAVSLSKAQLGLELPELEAAALLVQEEEGAGRAAQCNPSHQAPHSSPEPSDSDSTSSSGTEDSASEQEEPAGTQPSLLTSLQAPLLEEDSALIIRESGLCRNMASQGCEVSQGQPLASARAPLIEELGDALKMLRVSTPHGVSAGSHGSVEDAEERGQVPCD
ncbi:protein SHQ1 homolog isoform X1 [Mus musculus]|uniref:protein SHQ1 homolog isoform X1 n=1 Tax=Mus musculus TaxID=10090 RepID=UPI00001F403D|nr:protein SHQ1 homolog isoform X1 [Mus musculus]|eukprot:XP_006506731.1 PREDICTED: protein SHQ1 homolog isoform X1 [Mus musculus]